MIVPFRTTDLGLMVLTVSAQKWMSKPKLPLILEGLGARGLCKTVFAPCGLPVGVMVAVEKNSGACEVLVLTTDELSRHPLTFARAVRKELGILRGRFAKIDSLTSGDPCSERFLEWLGFKRNGLIDRPAFEGKSMMLWSLA